MLFFLKWNRCGKLSFVFIHSKNICSQSLRMPKIIPNFACFGPFWGPLNFWTSIITRSNYDDVAKFHGSMELGDLALNKKNIFSKHKLVGFWAFLIRCITK